MRWTLLLFISFVGLLANFASTNQPEIPQEAQQVLQSYERLSEARLAETVRSTGFQTWLPKDAIARIEDAQNALNEAKDKLAERGLENRALSFFTLGPEYDGLAGAVRELSAEPPPDNLISWEGSHFDNVITIYAGVDSAVTAQTGIERQTQLGDTAVVEKIPGVADSLQAVKELAEAIGSDEATAAQAETISKALATIETGLDELSKPFAGRPKDAIVDLANISGTMEKWHVSKLVSAIESAKAQVTAGELKAGSISAAGLSIPGVAIKLLLPLLALGIAIDIVLTLAKAVRWTGRHMVQRDAAFHVALFPWIPVLIFGGRSQTGTITKFLSWVALAVHLSPPVLLLALIYSGTGSPVVQTIGTLAITAVLACQIKTLQLIDQLSKQPSDEAVYKLGINDPTADLIKIHLERVDVAWTSLMTISGVASIFFIAFLFVPSELLSDRSQLTKVGGTRAALEVVYEQRFKDHRDTYEAWSKTVNDAFHQLTFMQIHFPEDHPGYALIETLSQKPPLYTYPSAKSNFDDIVTEDRASLNQLDFYDLNDLIELLYRPNLENLNGPLEEIRESIRAHPLPEEAVADLPDFLKISRGSEYTDLPLKLLYGKVAAPGISVNSPTTPLPITYRQWVEKSGFAYRLTPLPVRGKVDNLYAYIGDKGFSKVAGFDRYADAYTLFDKQLGTLKLSLFGVEVNRRLAATVASWLIVALIALLLMRLIVARRAIDGIDDEKSCATILYGTGVTFLNESGNTSSILAYGTSALLLVFPIFVLGLIEWSSTPSSDPLDWSLIAAIVGALLTVLCVGQRMALLRILPS